MNTKDKKNIFRMETSYKASVYTRPDIKFTTAIVISKWLRRRRPDYQSISVFIDDENDDEGGPAIRRVVDRISSIINMTFFFFSHFAHLKKNNNVCQIKSLLYTYIIYAPAVSELFMSSCAKTEEVYRRRTMPFLYYILCLYYYYYPPPPPVIFFSVPPPRVTFILFHQSCAQILVGEGYRHGGGGLVIY